MNPLHEIREEIRESKKLEELHEWLEDFERLPMDEMITRADACKIMEIIFRMFDKHRFK